MYELKQGKYQSGRSGPRLDAFPLAEMEVDQYFDIPLKVNKRGQPVPERGFNIKKANAAFSPRKFAKRKLEDVDGGVLRVWRVK